MRRKSLVKAVKDSWMVYFLIIGFGLLTTFAENEVIIVEIKYMAFIWVSLLGKITVS